LRGFTLVELLAVAGISLLLLGIAMPAYRSTRKSALGLTELATIRNDAVLVQAYAGEYDGLFPQDVPSPWVNAVSWARPMRQAGIVASETDLWWRVDQDGAWVHMVLSAAAVMNPGLMRLDHTVPAQDARTAPIRISRVAWPSGKGLLYPNQGSAASGAVWCCGEAAPAPVAFVDGSAIEAAWTELNPSGVLQIQDNVGYPVYSTWNGIEGRDR